MDWAIHVPLSLLRISEGVGVGVEVWEQHIIERCDAVRWELIYQVVL